VCAGSLPPARLSRTRLYLLPTNPYPSPKKKRKKKDV